MEPNIVRVIDAVWIALGILWWAGAATAKQNARTEPPMSRLVHLVIMVSAFAMLFYPPLRIGVLAMRWLPDTAVTGYTGLAITLAGAAFAIWARLYIGRNWSANVTIKQDHELVRGGPYAVVRHPIYSGLLLAVLGTAVALGEVRGLIAFVLALIGWRMKSLVEEKFMAEQFGDEYGKYKRKVKALIPFIF